MNALTDEYRTFLAWVAARFEKEGLTVDRAVRWLMSECGEVAEDSLLMEGAIPRKRHLHRDVSDLTGELGDVVMLGLIAMILAGADPEERLVNGVAKSIQRWKEFDGDE